MSVSVFLLCSDHTYVYSFTVRNIIIISYRIINIITMFFVVIIITTIITIYMR